MMTMMMKMRSVRERGLTLIEVLVGIMLVSVVALGMSSMVGTAIKTKLIIVNRTAGSETARQTLEWMAERIRNAGLNLQPTAQPQNRCKDMVVAQEVTMQPTGTSLYVSGEILNSNALAGDEVITLGYFLGNDPDTGKTVVMELSQGCGVGAVAVTKPLSAARVTVNALSFLYYDVAGNQVTALTTVSEIRKIRIIRISLTAQTPDGTTGAQTVTLNRDIMLRNPEPNANNWINPNEN